MNTININSENFKYELQQLINNANLPIANIYYIMLLAQKQLENVYYATLNSELAEMQKEQKEEKQTENIEE